MFYPTEMWQRLHPRALPRGMVRLSGGTDSILGGTVGSSCQSPSAKPRRMFAYPWESLGDNEELVNYYKVYKFIILRYAFFRYFFCFVDQMKVSI
jgi:hypothetical protein